MQRIPSWSVLVIYQDEQTREKAVRVCDGLVRRFWATANFDIRWVSFHEFGQETSWPTWTQLAVSAHLLIFAMAIEGVLPDRVQQWMEGWIEQRAGKEGAAIIGVGEKDYLAGPIPENFRFLRQLAHRAGMDYLTDIPEQMAPPFPEDTEFYTSRAETMTKVMGQILSQKLGPHEPPGGG